MVSFVVQKKKQKKAWLVCVVSVSSILVGRVSFCANAVLVGIVGRPGWCFFLFFSFLAFVGMCGSLNVEARVDLGRFGW